MRDEHGHKRDEHEEHVHGHLHPHDEHGHDHLHGHAHDHHEHELHEHEHSYESGITILEHEGALAASLYREFPGSYEEVKQLVATKLEALAAAVTQAGGIVGHIKATLSGAGRLSTLSTTGSAVHITEGNDPRNRVDVVAIVLLLDEDQLRLALEELFQLA